MDIRLSIRDTSIGCAVTSYDGDQQMDTEDIAKVGFLRWYRGDELLAEGDECACGVGETVECRLEG